MGGQPLSLLLLDTHAWLWWEAAPERLSAVAVEAIEEADQIAVAAISCWEVAMLVQRRRISLDRPVQAWIRQALARDRFSALPVTAAAALEAALLPSGEFPADPADRLIYSSARLAGAGLVTRDERLRRFDPALTVW